MTWKVARAWSAARHFRNAGAELALTYLNDKARPHVEPLAREVDAGLLLPCDVTVPGQLEAVFEAIRQRWGRLDFLMHAIAWARKEDLHGRLTDCSAEGFAESMLVSCHCEMAFRNGPIMVFQIQLARQRDAVPSHRNYIAEWERALENRANNEIV